MYTIELHEDDFSLEDLQKFVSSREYDIFLWIEDPKIVERANTIWINNNDGDISIKNDHIEIDICVWDTFLKRLNKLDREFEAKIGMALYADRTMKRAFNVNIVRDIPEEYFN